MQTASLELCRELYQLSGWYDAELIGRVWWLDKRTFKDGRPVGSTEFQLSCGSLVNEFMKPKEYEAYPAYDDDYLRVQLKNYDWTIVNLNRKQLSLTSESLDNPDAAILGATFAEVLCKLAIELFKQGILHKDESPKPTTQEKGSSDARQQ